jgi:murein L,D-transpeptidase YafK
MKPAFTAAGVAWPPHNVLLVAFKDERRLELFASESGVREVTLVVPSDLRHVAGWPILAASGGAGPKLRAGDRQVPEGLYSIESLNPMSRFHLALRVAYPNDFDKAHAKEDGRDDLGGDIMVHGSNTSIGCLAMGDEVAEDLFVIAALAGVENVSILIAPCDLRTRTYVIPPPDAPAWTGTLWDGIRSILDELPRT